MNELTVIDGYTIQDKIYTIRAVQVMLDKDLAVLYGVDTKRINEAVKNNQEKFQEDFFFELSDEEFNHLRSKISTANFSKSKSKSQSVYRTGCLYVGDYTKKQSCCTNHSFDY
jgi:hypothetical protein